MAIGAIDKTTTKKLTKTLKRKEKRCQHKAEPSHSEPSTSGTAALASLSESDSTSTTDDNSDFEDKTKIYVELIFGDYHQLH